VNRRFGTTVPGVGDEAFLRGDAIAVIQGHIGVSIRLQGDRVADRTSALRRLAATAAGRLATAAGPSPDGGPTRLSDTPTPPEPASGPS
jgi:hypothetical protein